MGPGNEVRGEGQRWEWSLGMRLGNAMLGVEPGNNSRGKGDQAS